LEAVKAIILSEINVKEMEFITDTSGVLVKKIKPNFKSLGPKHGKIMKQIAGVIAQMTQEDIVNFESTGEFVIVVNDENVALTLQDVEIISEDIPGWLVANEGKLTVALDVNITEELRKEGIAREFINRIQNLRKDSDFDVTDKIRLEIAMHDAINDAVIAHKDYIGSQTLAVSVDLVESLDGSDAKAVEIEQGVESYIRIKKLSE